MATAFAAQLPLQSTSLSIAAAAATRPGSSLTRERALLALSAGAGAGQRRSVPSLRSVVRVPRPGHRSSKPTTQAVSAPTHPANGIVNLWSLDYDASKARPAVGSSVRGRATTDAWGDDSQLCAGFPPLTRCGLAGQVRREPQVDEAHPRGREWRSWPN